MRQIHIKNLKNAIFRINFYHSRENNVYLQCKTDYQKQTLMRYRIKKETKPTLTTFGKYKAVAVHDKTIESKQVIKETAKRMGISEGTVHGIMISLGEIVNQHLREGDRVRLQDLGMMKLEIESEKVDNPKAFRAKKHIRGVRLHFLPESNEGTQALYDGITFEKDKNYKEE